MLLTIQFPLADARKFLTEAPILSVPGWPLPTPNQEFVRYFGCVRIRKTLGLIDWVGENEICVANQAIKFLKNPISLFSSSNNQKKFGDIYRQLYYDGWAVGKFEVSLATKKRPGISLNQNDLSHLIDGFLTLPVQIRNPLKKGRDCHLARAGAALAKLYNVATLKSPISNAHSIEDWWVSNGSPMLFLEYRGEVSKFVSFSERIEFPYPLKQVDLPRSLQFQLFYCLVPYEGGNIPMWVFNTPMLSRASNAKILRMHLARLHAEQECLRLILRHILNGRISIERRTEESDNLQHYLNQALKRIKGLEASIYERDPYYPLFKDIAKVAHHSSLLMSPGQYQALLQQLERIDMRRNILLNVQKYSRDWKNESVSQIDVKNLRQLLIEFLNETELRDLCFDLGVDYESLDAIGKAGKARELIDYMKRHDRLVEMVENVRELRPNLSW